MKTIEIKARGQKWHGHWRQDGKEVLIDSAYGSARLALGRKDPAKVAAAALGDLVEAWAQR